MFREFSSFQTKNVPRPKNENKSYTDTHTKIVSSEHSQQPDPSHDFTQSGNAECSPLIEKNNDRKILSNISYRIWWFILVCTAGVLLFFVIISFNKQNNTSIHTISDNQNNILVQKSFINDMSMDTNLPRINDGTKNNTGTKITDTQSIMLEDMCFGPFPGYPYCVDKIKYIFNNWDKTIDSKNFYKSKGVDGTRCSIVNYLHNNGFYCPEVKDIHMLKIRGVNIGGWLVVEPWITPSIFEQFQTTDNVIDMWTLCTILGKIECETQLNNHYNTFLTENDILTLKNADINHVRIPYPYWIMGNIDKNEPWVNNVLKYFNRALNWCKKYNMNVILDLHCAPGSQNGFDNSCKKGNIEWNTVDSTGKYSNIIRTLNIIKTVSEYISTQPYKNIIVGHELINEAFINIPIQIVKDFYLQGYEVIKNVTDIAVIIGDSFRFDDWDGFMFPPYYNHVWIDTHIYQMFDEYRLGFSWQDHLKQTCFYNKPQVSVAPLSVIVGEWSLATTDCAKWLNGVGTGSRYEASNIGSCFNDHTLETFSSEYKQFLNEFFEKQVDAYESGSSAGWFFWNFKTENAPQWDYLVGLKQGWIPQNLTSLSHRC